MEVHVLDITGSNSRIVHGKLHGAGRLLAALGQPHPVEGLACGAVARDLPVDLRLTLTGMVIFF
jgi:hypothetical protein